MIVKTDDQYYSEIASAIRAKNETNTTYKPSEMAIAIENIESGGIQCTLSISTTPNAAVTATLSGTTVSAKANSSGVAVLELPKEGVWTVTATADGESASIQIDTTFFVTVNLQFFPSQPSAYEYIALITASQTWKAPEDGWYQIEVFGASGNGGSTYTRKYDYGGTYYYGYGGSGGGGGGYSCSRIKMNKGDTIALTVGYVGSNTTATINSSLETYSSIKITSGKNGYGSNDEEKGGGAGGVASGGNFANNNGKSGGSGSEHEDTSTPAIHGIGGAPGYAGGNTGGNGGIADYNAPYGKTTEGSPGSAGFFKIYRGNTNVA